MIVAVSTSSPVASVALFDRSGDLLASAEREAPMAASGACLALLEELLATTDTTLAEASLFVADLGPGSFTGVRVGVTLVKTWAFALGTMTGGATAFDLVSPTSVVVLPSKRGEFFVRRPGCEPERVVRLPDEPFVGYGVGISNPRYPSANRLGPVLPLLPHVRAEELVPRYLIEPSISVPKRNFGGLPTGA